MQQESIFKVRSFSGQCYTMYMDNDFDFHIWHNTDTVYHMHENYIEMFILLKGSISNTMLGETYVLVPGDVGLVLPNVPHRHNTVNAEDVELLNVTCKIEIAEMIFSNIYHRPQPKSAIRKLQTKELKIVKNFRNMIMFADNNAEYNTSVASLCFYLLGIFKNSAPVSQQTPEPFQKFLNSLQDIDLEFVKISDLYQKSGYSQRTLSTYFQKYLNQTLVQYVNSIKLNRAKNLLRSTDLPITEISSKIGFNSIAHFNHLFKEKFGLSPKEYRALPAFHPED